MSLISLAMIVKNEEKVLDRCLTSVKGLFDEIIIVDTGSTDKTKQIAKKYTNKIYDFKWVNDFSKARNYSFSLCSSNYIMWLDADDVFNKNQINKFKKLKEELNKNLIDVVMMKYNIAFDDNNKPTFSYYRERIVKNNKQYVWNDPVHEVITPSGNIVYSDIFIEHRKIENKKISNRNLKIYESLIKQKIQFSPRQMYYYARELMFNKKYKKAIKEFHKFLIIEDAFKENLICACKDLSYCYLQTNNLFNAKLSLIQSFIYDLPRADICCKLGDLFIYDNNYQIAVFWYEKALQDKVSLKSGGFIEWQYYGIYPCLQLCACYYRLNNNKKAIYYNNLAGKFDKTNKQYLSNLNFFNNIKNDAK